MTWDSLLSSDIINWYVVFTGSLEDEEFVVVRNMFHRTHDYSKNSMEHTILEPVVNLALPLCKIIESFTRYGTKFCGRASGMGNDRQMLLSLCLQRWISIMRLLIFLNSFLILIAELLQG